MDPRRFYKTTYTVTVLSEDHPATGMPLTALDQASDSGPLVAKVDDDGGVPLSGREAAECLKALGSDPGFFRLDDLGRPVE